MSESKDNIVQIVSIKPDPTNLLYVGDKVEIEVEIEYNVSSSPIEIALNIQNGNLTNDELHSVLEIKDEAELVKKFASLVISRKTEVVSDKKGKLVLKDSFEVPETNSIRIFTPITLQGEASTDIVDSRFYKVTQKN